MAKVMDQIKGFIDNWAAFLAMFIIVLNAWGIAALQDLFSFMGYNFLEWLAMLYVLKYIIFDVLKIKM